MDCRTVDTKSSSGPMLACHQNPAEYRLEISVSATCALLVKVMVCRLLIAQPLSQPALNVDYPLRNRFHWKFDLKSSELKWMKTHLKVVCKTATAISFSHCVNRPISQIPQCTCSISHNAPFRTEMCTHISVLNSALWDMKQRADSRLAPSQ